VRDRSRGVKYDADEIASATNSDNLSTASLSVLRSLDDTGQIKQLNLGTLVIDDSGYARECRELVRCNLREGASQLCQQSGFAYGREANEANTGVSCFGNVKPFTSTTTTSTFGHQKLSLVLCKFSFEDSQVLAGCFVLLGASHLKTVNPSIKEVEEHTSSSISLIFETNVIAEGQKKMKIRDQKRESDKS
jgi:hypothetical protein